MDWMNQIGGLLHRYAGTSPRQAPDSAVDDFHKVAQSAPQGAISDALANAFRSDSTPPFPQMLSQLFGHSDNTQKATILNMLTGAVGSGALQQILSNHGAGAASLAGLFGGATHSVTPEQASSVSPDAVRDLAAHAEQKDQSIIDRISDFYAQQPATVKALGVGALALILTHIGNKHSVGR